MAATRGAVGGGIRSIVTLAVAAMLGLGTVYAADATWPEYHGTWRAWQYSPLDQVNQKNIRKLKVAWIHQPGDISQGLEATPIEVDGVLYYSGSNNRVFALDPSTGKELWHYYAELKPVAKRSFFGFYNRGVAVGRGKVFVGSSDGRLIALDQKTGKEVWQVQLTDLKTCNGCNFTSPPVVAGDVVILGPTGGDLADRGHLYAVNAESGQRQWTLDLVKEDTKSWPGNTADSGGGGAWMPGQYDAEDDVFYIGVSNPAPDFDAKMRRGDNLYTAAMLAIKPKDGKIVWYHQEVPNDSWDYDSIYAFLMIEKDGNRYIVHLNKDGFVSVLERKTGKVVNVWQLAKTVNFVKTIDPKTGELIERNEPEAGKDKVICPSALGVRSWNAGAYSPKTKLYYTNSYDLCNSVTLGTQDPKTIAFSQPYYNSAKFNIMAPPGKAATAELGAFDPMTGKEVWSVSYEMPGLATVLATAGGLVFNADPQGWLHAYADDSGQELWNFNMGSGSRGGIISYSVDGKQYIVVASGLGSLFTGFASGVWPQFKEVRGGAALIAFTVDN